MNFLDNAKKRYSVRSYKSQKVEQEKLDLILEAARVAPTAANLQPVRLIVVQERRAWRKSKRPPTYTMHLWLLSCAPITAQRGPVRLIRSRLEISMPLFSPIT